MPKKFRKEPLEYYNSLLQYHFGIADPASLSDKLWVLKIKHLEYFREEEAKHKSINLTS